MGKKGFIMYGDYFEYLSYLSKDEKADILVALYVHYFGGDEESICQNMSTTASLAFSFMRNQMDRDTEKYEHTCEQRRKYGAMGGRPPKDKSKKKEEEKKTSSFDTDDFFEAALKKSYETV